MKVASVATRQSCFTGVVMGVWRFNDLLASVLNAFSTKAVYMQVYDVGVNRSVFVGKSGSDTELLPNATVPPSSRVLSQTGACFPPAVRCGMLCMHFSLYWVPWASACSCRVGSLRPV